ncbi:MAG: cytochrome c nitrite reductase small subunit [Ignavibacteriales bacterium]|nr:MAG: cytochrome c nitrite reductase small subunit [Ignavibacteriales bacterium]
MNLKKIISSLIPPPQWRAPVIIAIGVIFGLGFVIAHISNATSYLSDDPKACVNCHVMNPQFATWQRSSHARVTTCNDCHVPHDNFIRTYLFKASDGLRHATMFTFRLEPQVIRIHEAGRNVVQENCIRCHSDLINQTNLITMTGESADHGNGKLCWDCHREVPHGRVNSLSSFPFVRVPQLTPVMPEWIEKNISNEKSN